MGNGTEVGLEAANRCDECRRCRRAGYRGTTGWFTGGDGARHNHLTERARSSSPANDAGRAPAPTDPLKPTAAEMYIAAQLGLSEQDIRAQKGIDVTNELAGRVSALELTQHVEGGDEWQL